MFRYRLPPPTRRNAKTKAKTKARAGLSVGKKENSRPLEGEADDGKDRNTSPVTESAARGDEDYHGEHRRDGDYGNLDDEDDDRKPFLRYGGPLERAVRRDLLDLRGFIVRSGGWNGDDRDGDGRGGVGAPSPRSRRLPRHATEGSAFKLFKSEFSKQRFSVAIWNAVPPRSDVDGYAQIVYSACLGVLADALDHEDDDGVDGCVRGGGGYLRQSSLDETAFAVFALYALHGTEPHPAPPPFDAPPHEQLRALPLGFGSGNGEGMGGLGGNRIRRRAFKSAIRIDVHGVANLHRARDEALATVSNCEAMRMRSMEDSMKEVEVGGRMQQRESPSSSWRCTCQPALDVVRIVDRMQLNGSLELCEYPGPGTLEGLAGSSLINDPPRPLGGAANAKEKRGGNGVGVGGAEGRGSPRWSSEGGRIGDDCAGDNTPSPRHEDDGDDNFAQEEDTSADLHLDLDVDSLDRAVESYRSAVGDLSRKIDSVERRVVGTGGSSRQTALVRRALAPLLPIVPSRRTDGDEREEGGGGHGGRQSSSLDRRWDDVRRRLSDLQRTACCGDTEDQRRVGASSSRGGRILFAAEVEELDRLREVSGVASSSSSSRRRMIGPTGRVLRRRYGDEAFAVAAASERRAASGPHPAAAVLPRDEAPDGAMERGGSSTRARDEEDSAAVVSRGEDGGDLRRGRGSDDDYAFRIVYPSGGTTAPGLKRGIACALRYLNLSEEDTETDDDSYVDTREWSGGDDVVMRSSGGSSEQEVDNLGELEVDEVDAQGRTRVVSSFRRGLSSDDELDEEESRVERELDQEEIVTGAYHRATANPSSEEGDVESSSSAGGDVGRESIDDLLFRVAAAANESSSTAATTRPKRRRKRRTGREEESPESSEGDVFTPPPVEPTPRGVASDIGRASIDDLLLAVVPEGRGGTVGRRKTKSAKRLQQSDEHAVPQPLRASPNAEAGNGRDVGRASIDDLPSATEGSDGTSRPKGERSRGNGNRVVVSGSQQTGPASEVVGRGEDNAVTSINRHDWLLNGAADDDDGSNDPRRKRLRRTRSTTARSETRSTLRANAPSACQTGGVGGDDDIGRRSIDELLLATDEGGGPSLQTTKKTRTRTTRGKGFAENSRNDRTEGSHTGIVFSEVEPVQRDEDIGRASIEDLLRLIGAEDHDSEDDSSTTWKKGRRRRKSTTKMPLTLSSSRTKNTRAASQTGGDGGDVGRRSIDELLLSVEG